MVDKRHTIELSAQELEDLRTLPRHVGAAFNFWRQVCVTRDLDYRTLIGRTALPLGHGKHWCWPWPLQCSQKPQNILRYGPR